MSKMAQEIKIKIKTRIKDVMGEIEENTFVTEGSLYEKENELYIRYKEQQELGNTWTVVKWEKAKRNKPRVSLIRQGDVRLTQVFQEGIKQPSRYQTPHGALDMNTITKSVVIEQGSDKGAISLDYELEINNGNVGDYYVVISFRKKQ